MNGTFGIALAITVLTPIVVAFLGVRMLKRGIGATVTPGVVVALLLRVVTVTALVILMYFGTSGSKLGPYYQQASRAHFGVQVQFLLINEAIGIAVAFLLWGFLEFVHRRRPETMQRGEPLMVAVLCLIAGWPNILLAVTIMLVLAVFGSLVLAVFRRSLEHRVRLGVAAVLAAFVVTVLPILVPSSVFLLDRLRL